MPQRLTYEYNPLSYAYPDDESDKELFLQATLSEPGLVSRVLLYWINVIFSDGEEVWQVVRLYRHEDNNVHKYIYPDMIVVDGCEREHHETFSLGVFTRDMRELVLEFADEVEYEERPEEEGQCLRWMSALLECIVREGLVEQSVVDAIRDAVRLP